MKSPIKKYLNYLFAKRRVLGDSIKLNGLVAADMILSDLVNKKKVPGLSIMVIKKGEVLLQKGYGYADLENKMVVDPKRTIFRIASVSKPISATALAHMVAEGKIDLDTSFYDYVPYYPKKQWDFNIRQLASHTAGIRGYQGMEYGLNKPYSIKESMEIFKDDALLFEPGTDYQYNSYDWVLVSMAMQEASGIPFENYVQEKVLEPLRMTSTFPEGHPERSRGLRNTKVKWTSTALSQTNNLTTFYTKNRKGFRPAIPVNNFYKLAGGGYISTSVDVAKFGQAYLDNAILDQKILSQFLTAQTVNGKSTYYGLGWQVSEDQNGRKFYGHIGSGVGGYSNFFVYPEEQLVFSILVNCTDPNIQVELDEVVNRLFEATDELA